MSETPLPILLLVDETQSKTTAWSCRRCAKACWRSLQKPSSHSHPDCAELWWTDSQPGQNSGGTPSRSGAFPSADTARDAAVIAAQTVPWSAAAQSDSGSGGNRIVRRRTASADRTSVSTPVRFSPAASWWSSTCRAVLHPHLPIFARGNFAASAARDTRSADGARSGDFGPDDAHLVVEYKRLCWTESYRASARSSAIRRQAAAVPGKKLRFCCGGRDPERHWQRWNGRTFSHSRSGWTDVCANRRKLGGKRNASICVGRWSGDVLPTPNAIADSLRFSFAREKVQDGSR